MGLYWSLSALKDPVETDFIEYWSAFRLAGMGVDIYNPTLVAAFQTRMGKSFPLMMWNPPWTLSIFAPVLMMAFHAAASVWFCLNVTFIAFAGALMGKVYSRRGKGVALGVLSALSFSPVLFGLKIGQVSSFLAFCITCFIWAMKKGSLFVVALALVGLSLKPHLLIPFSLLFFFGELQQRRWGVLLRSIGILGILTVPLALAAPESFVSWLRAPFCEQASADIGPLLSWKGMNIARLLRDVFGNGDKPVWPLLIVPLAGTLLAFLLYGWRMKEFRWEIEGLVVLGISLLFAPFGWFFDYSLMLAAQVAVVIAVAERSEFGWPEALALGILAVTSLLSADSKVLYLHVEWVPLALLGAAFLVIPDFREAAVSARAEFKRPFWVE